MAKREYYSHARADKRKVEKRKEAEERTAARAERTNEEQLARLDGGHWKASKERKKLQTRMDIKKRINRGKRDESTRRNTKRD